MLYASSKAEQELLLPSMYALCAKSERTNDPASYELCDTASQWSTNTPSSKVSESKQSNTRLEAVQLASFLPRSRTDEGSEQGLLVWSEESSDKAKNELS